MDEMCTMNCCRCKAEKFCEREEEFEPDWRSICCGEPPVKLSDEMKCWRTIDEEETEFEGICSECGNKTKFFDSEYERRMSEMKM